MTSAAPGGGTRHESAGRTSTSRALSTIAEADMEASTPAGPARGAHRSSATTRRPATCATAMSGTAARLRIGPASVTRENEPAETGISTTSTATDATIEAAIHRRNRFVLIVPAAAAGPPHQRVLS